jgi:hypothetical protein
MQLFPSLESLLVFLGSATATLVAGYIFSLIARRSLKKYNPQLAEAVARYGSWTIYLAGFLFPLELLNLKFETILAFLVILGVLMALGLKDVLPNLLRQGGSWRCTSPSASATGSKSARSRVGCSKSTTSTRSW